MYVHMAHFKYIQTNHRKCNCVVLISHLSFGTPMWPMYVIVNYVVMASLVYIYLYGNIVFVFLTLRLPL